ncbi:MAG TPA: exonuclease SbcCD subunit D [Actinomycetota bacterium]|nr:exonuclease SbcCD subunit D [Actinomycetota bacterium]
MRFLHTGDWHVGKAIRGRSRAEEFSAALDEVVGIAVDEGVDCVLLAGDVYEHRAPAPEADAVVFEAFLRLHDAGIRVVAIPGNHDSPLRLEAFGKVLRPLGIEIVPKVARPDAGGVVVVPSRDGAEEAEIAAIPFVPERRFGDAAALFDAGQAWYQGYAQGMGELLGAMASGFTPGRIPIVLAHLFTDGALVTPGGGERELTIGIAYAVPPSRLPGEAAYVALGHVHLPQAVKGSAAPARFAGSLLQLDFGEAGQRKSVAIVDAAPGKPARVNEVPLSSGRQLKDLRGTLDELLAQGAAAGQAWLRVFVETDGPVPGIADRIRDDLPNALDVHLVYERAEGDGGGGEPLSSLAPRDQFVAYHEAQHGAPPPETLLEAFDEVLELETEGVA